MYCDICKKRIGKNNIFVLFMDFVICKECFCNILRLLIIFIITLMVL